MCQSLPQSLDPPRLVLSVSQVSVNVAASVSLPKSTSTFGIVISTGLNGGTCVIVRRRDLDGHRRQSELPWVRVFACAWRAPLRQLDADIRETCVTTKCVVLASPRVYYVTDELERDRGAEDECCARRTSTSRVLLTRCHKVQPFNRVPWEQLHRTRQRTREHIEVDDVAGEYGSASLSTRIYHHIIRAKSASDHAPLI